MTGRPPRSTLFPHPPPVRSTVVVTDLDTAGNTANASITFLLDKTIATPEVPPTELRASLARVRSPHLATMNFSAAAAALTPSLTVDGGAAPASQVSPTADPT